MRRVLVCVAIAMLGVGSALAGATHAASADTAGPGSSGGATATTTVTTTATAAAVIATAQQYLGYPYAYIGDDPSTGFSCIGFVHYVFAKNGVYVPEDLGKAYISAPRVAQSDLQPGDLVFFQNTVWNGISHVALYTGNGQMIAADSFQTGVTTDTLSDPYWQEHYLGATRPLSDPSGTPPNPAATPMPSGPTLAPATPTPSGPVVTIKAGTTLTPQHSATVYSGPGDTYTAIDTVTPATALTAVQTQGQWVNVSYNGGGQYGWIHGPDLSVSTAPAGPGSGPRQNTGAGPAQRHSHVRRVRSQSVAGFYATHSPMLTVTASVLFVRANPSMHGRILRRVHAGDRLRLLSTGDGWDYVVLRDLSRGWVSALWVH